MMRFERYQSGFQDSVLALHRSAIVGFSLGMTAAQDEADIKGIEELYLRNGGEFLVGFAENDLIAMGGFLRLSPDTAELKRMRIAQEFQGKGYGGHLLRELEGIAFRGGIRTLVLATASRRPLTLEFYRKNGYRETGTGFYGAVETIEFSKSLADE